MDNKTCALAHLNSAEEAMLGLPRWLKWLMGWDYDYILKDGIQMAQQYLEEPQSGDSNNDGVCV